jgi:hypothetical protein
LAKVGSRKGGNWEDKSSSKEEILWGEGRESLKLLVLNKTCQKPKKEISTPLI